MFEGVGGQDDRRTRIAGNSLTKRAGDESNELLKLEETEEKVFQMFFDARWINTWVIDYKDIVFGPSIGAGGFRQSLQLLL